MAAPAPTTGLPTTDPDLDALLVTEQRLERSLVQARAEADAVRATAVAAIAGEDAAAERALEAEVRDLAERLTADAAALVASLEAEARAEAAAWNALAGVALDEVAARLRRRLVALILEPS